jgi:hypothetical protein
MATPGEKQEMEEVLDIPASSSTTLPATGKQEYSEADHKVSTSPFKDEDQSSVAPSDVASSSAAPDVVVYHKPPPKQFALIMIAYVYFLHGRELSLPLFFGCHTMVY